MQRRALWWRLVVPVWVVVAVVAGCAGTRPDGQAADPPDTRQATPAQAPGASLVGLAGLEDKLTELYRTVEPSVVNVQVAKKIDQPDGAGMGMPGMQDPFEHFFGHPPQQQRPDGQTPHDQYQRGSGSGFCWDRDGHFVTNNHVVADADKITVTFADGSMARAELVGADPDSDLAVLKVKAAKDKLVPVTVEDGEVRVGQLAVAIGNPFGLEGTMTVGFVSALGRLLPVDLERPEGNYTIPDVIQTDAPINPGNSGGVLINSAGKVMGVTSAIASPNGASAGIGFAIPATIVAKVVPALIREGHYDHTYLGLSGLTLTPDAAEAMKLKPDQRGALVIEVQSGSPADKAGIRGGSRTAELDGVPLRIGGDVIVKMGDEPVRRFDDVVSILARETTVGQQTTITVLRDGRETTLKVTLEARPGQPEEPTKVAAAPEAGQAYLGIEGSDLSPDIAAQMDLPRGQHGVLIRSVTFGSPADQAGLRGSDKRAMIGGQPVEVGGDVITAIDGKPLRSMRQLQQLIANAKVGDALKLTILRDGKETTAEVTLAAPPR